MKETKVYLNKMPESCWDCFCQDNENGRCKILEKYTDYVPKDCPLIDIKVHDRELVRQVCEKIRKSSYDILYEEGQFDISDMECVVEDIKNEFRFSWVYKKDTK